MCTDLCMGSLEEDTHLLLFLRGEANSVSKINLEGKHLLLGLHFFVVGFFLIRTNHTWAIVLDLSCLISIKSV